MGFFSNKLFKMEERNNLRILDTLQAMLYVGVEAKLVSVACQERQPDHSGIRVTFNKTGEFVDMHRCRQRWFMSAPGEPTLPMVDVDPLNPEMAALQIAMVANEISQEQDDS